MADVPLQAVVTLIGDDQLAGFDRGALTPASALPRRVDETLNLDGSGQPDVRVTFTVPADPHARPTGSVTALNARYKSFAMPGSYSFSQMIVQSGGAVVIRVPLAKRGLSAREAQRVEQSVRSG